MINLLDVILIIFFLWKGWRGMKNGFILEFGGFLIIYISFITSTNQNFFTDISIEIMKLFNISADYKWLFCFFCIYIMLFLILRIINRLIKTLALGYVNGLLGCLFGVIKWWVILNVIVFGFMFANKKLNLKPEANILNENIVQNSLVFKLIKYTLNKSTSYF